MVLIVHALDMELLATRCSQCMVKVYGLVVRGIVIDQPI